MVIALALGLRPRLVLVKIVLPQALQVISRRSPARWCS
jgi:ABC-type amino acid transport system permease subunit